MKWNIDNISWMRMTPRSLFVSASLSNNHKLQSTHDNPVVQLNLHFVNQKKKLNLLFFFV